MTELSLPLHPRRLADVVHSSCAKVFHSVDRKGLPPRNWLQRLDQKLMGDLATLSLQAHLESHHALQVVSYDAVRADDYRMRDPGWDLAISKSNIQPWQPAWQPPPALCTLSVKSSRVPQSDGSVVAAVERRDFKILAYSLDIIDDLHADIEVQVYYDLAASQLPLLLDASERDIRKAAADVDAAFSLFERILAHDRFSRCVCVGFVSYRRLSWHVAHSEPDRRQFLMPGMNKRFWSAPLKRLAVPLQYLPQAIAEISTSGERRPKPIEPDNAIDL